VQWNRTGNLLGPWHTQNSELCIDLNIKLSTPKILFRIGLGGGCRKGWRRVNVVEYYVHMYVNGKMRPGETVPGIWRGGRGADKGEWWREWNQLWYIVRVFINATMHPQYNNNMKKKGSKKL
jgi:hypothetical protein